MSTKEHTVIPWHKTGKKTAVLHHPAHKKIICAALLAAILLTALLIALFFGKPLIAFVTNTQAFRQWISNHALTGVLSFVGIRALQTIITILPAEAIEIGAGYAFGIMEGVVLCTIGSAIGSAAIYLFTKKFGVRLIEVFIPMKKIQSFGFIKNAKRLNLFIFLIFIIPGTPKDTLTYLIGLTPMRLPTFLILSSIARFPSIITSTIGGAALGKQNYLFAGLLFGITAIISLAGIFFYRHMTKSDKTAGMKMQKPANAKDEVIKMSKKYQDLYTLMEEDAQAKQYFSELPDYVQEQISTRAGHVNSIDSLKDYAENLLRGDD